MSKHIFSDGEEITIRHIMADGCERESVEGYFVPVNEQTAPAYHILINWIDREMLKEY